MPDVRRSVAFEGVHLLAVPRLWKDVARMTTPDNGPYVPWWKRALRAGQRQRRAFGAMDGLPWFRAGYITALDDIERTGLRPTTTRTKREAADRALERWVEDGHAR